VHSKSHNWNVLVQRNSVARQMPVITARRLACAGGDASTFDARNGVRQIVSALLGTFRALKYLAGKNVCLFVLFVCYLA
jgi:hypothetical protein